MNELIIDDRDLADLILRDPIKPYKSYRDCQKRKNKRVSLSSYRNSRTFLLFLWWFVLQACFTRLTKRLSEYFSRLWQLGLKLLLLLQILNTEVHNCRDDCTSSVPWQLGWDSVLTLSVVRSVRLWSLVFEHNVQILQLLERLLHIWLPFDQILNFI